MALVVETCILIVTLAAVGYLYVRHIYGYWARRKIVYLEPKFPAGNLYSVLPKGPSMGLQSAVFYKQFKAMGAKYGGIYAVTNPMLVVTDLDLVKDVMIKDFGNFSDRGLYHDKENDPINVTLFHQEEADWRSMRSKLTPAFTINKLRSVSTIISQLASNMVNYMDNNPGTMDVKYVAQGYTMDVIGTTVFGINCNCLNNAKTPFREAMLKLFNPSILHILEMGTIHFFPNLAKKLGLKLMSNEVRNFFVNMVQDMAQYREKNNISRPDLFQSLLDLKNNPAEDFTLMEVTAQAALFFVAGYETSSSTIMYCLLELARNEELQERARNDVLQSIKNNKGVLDYDAINQMKYLHQCVSETLRIYPSLPTLTRRTIKDYKIKKTNDIIEKNTIVLIPAYALQHDPKIWPEPEKFDPERFNEQNRRNIDAGSYLPFGIGPRNCIGYRFGEMQAMIGLSTLLTNYRFTMHKDMVYPVQFDPDQFSMVNTTAVKLNFEKIK